MKILHAPTNVGSNPSGLCAAERAIGLNSTCMSYRIATNQELVDDKVELSGGVLRKEFQRHAYFWKHLRYDVYHFNFGQSFFSYPGPASVLDGWDLPLLKHLGKRIIVTFQGCDARDRHMASSMFNISACAQPACGQSVCTQSMARRKKRIIARFERYADHIFTVNPDLKHFLPARAEFIPYASVSPEKFSPLPPKTDGTLTIAHAPTDDVVKGSRYVEEAIHRLCDENPAIRYLPIRNVPHTEALQLISQADVFVDQALVGWYGAAAVEAMAMGKPVVCYLRQDDLHFLPQEMRSQIPIFYSEPNNIHAVLSDAVANRDSLHQKGMLARRFAEQWHNPVRIAARMAEVYQGQP